MQIFKFRSNRGLKDFGYWGLLVISIGAVYWPLIRYPFVADDWLYLHFYLQHGFAASVKRFVLTYHVAASYCPLPSLLSIVLYNLAGLKPVVFRLATLAMVFANALLITRIARHILKDKLLACAAGILFATTAKIHIFPVVSFISGFCEAGVVFFFCWSFIMFVKKRYGLSALIFLLALLTKASAAVLPFVLCAYAFFGPREDRIRPFRQALYALRFHLLILLAAAFPVIASPGWRVDAWGPHILENLKYYYQRSLFFLFPRPSVAAYIGVAALFIFLSGALYAFVRARRQAAHAGEYRYAWRFWLCWLVAGLIPPSIMSTGQLKYYLMLAWPAYVVLFLLLIKFFSNLFRCGRVCFFLLTAVLALAGAGSSAAYVFKNDARGMESNELMIKGGHFVAAIQDALLKNFPRVPSQSVVLFEGFEKKDIYPLWFLSHEDGALHVWYRDFTVEALRLTDLRARDGQLHSESPKYTYGMLPKKSKRIDARRAFFIVSLQGRDVVVRRISGADLYSMVLTAGK